MNETEFLSIRAFAKLTPEKVSHVTIKKYVDRGLIPLIQDKIPKEAGLKAWASCRQIGYEKAAAAGKKYGGDPKKTKKPITEDYADDEDGSPDDPKWVPRLNKARALVQEQMVIKRKLENEIEQGRWVLKTDVKQEASALAGAIKQKLISIAPIIAVTAEGKTGLQIQKIVEFHINEVLKQLQELEK